MRVGDRAGCGYGVTIAKLVSGWSVRPAIMAKTFGSPSNWTPLGRPPIGERVVDLDLDIGEAQHLRRSRGVDMLWSAVSV